MIFLDFLTFIICSSITFLAVKKIRVRNYNILDICIIVYWGIQVLPILVQYCFKLDSVINGIWYNSYFAMSDFLTGVIYNFITILTVIIFAFYSERIKKTSKEYNIMYLKNILNHPIINILLSIGMFFPVLIAVIFAPNPKVYFTYSYFYMNPIDMLADTYIFHAIYVNKLCFLSVLFILLKYFSKQKNKWINKIDIIFAIFLCVWINGKRGILIVLLLGIIVIDLFDSLKANRKIITKTILFLVVIISYFKLFSYLTGKQSGSDFFYLYNLYFSRLGSEKLSIYDSLYTNKMLQYPGQSVLFDLLFFVPRKIWLNKPSFFAAYYTGYAYFGDGSRFLRHNLLVNIWSEFYANFGILGHFIALYIIITLAKYAERSASFLVYFAISIFIICYMSFGFEWIVLFIYAFMIFMIFYDKVRYKNGRVFIKKYRKYRKIIEV